MTTAGRGRVGAPALPLPARLRTLHPEARTMSSRVLILREWRRTVLAEAGQHSEVPRLREELRKGARVIWASGRGRPPRQPRSPRGWLAPATAGARLSPAGRSLARRALTAGAPQWTRQGQARFLAEAVTAGGSPQARQRAARDLWAAAVETFLSAPSVALAAQALTRAERALCAALAAQPAREDPRGLTEALAALQTLLDTLTGSGRTRDGTAGGQPAPAPAHPRTRVHALCAAPGAPSRALAPAAA